ncbi:imm11 family protein, partial [Xanthomonas citri]|uniref:imm11 family protein n=1 Tax=Xanthomonas citri TaxID=346 RepID=UPI001072572F
SGFVSEPLKEVFESVDSKAFAFAKCELTLYDGSQAAPHYFCEVIREIDALDEEASTVKILTEGYPKGKHYSLVGGASLVFRRDMLGPAHVFRTPYNGALVICDRLFRDALIEHGFGKARAPRGVWLCDAADY